LSGWDEDDLVWGAAVFQFLPPAQKLCRESDSGRGGLLRSGHLTTTGNIASAPTNSY
jgi:hypothetical protein